MPRPTPIPGNQYATSWDPRIQLAHYATRIIRNELKPLRLGPARQAQQHHFEAAVAEFPAGLRC
eukprot:530763-Alexandrium_andersonii.AAC.1